MMVNNDNKEHYLIMIINNENIQFISKAINNEKLVISLFLDISTAFDSIGRSILI